MSDIYRELIKLFSCFPNLYHVSVTVTTCIALPLYVFVLFVLFKSRNLNAFDSTFYKLVQILGIFDILSVVHAYVFIKLAEFGKFYDFYVYFANTKELQLLVRYGQGAFMILSFCQFFGTTLTSLNALLPLLFQ